MRARAACCLQKCVLQPIENWQLGVQSRRLKNSLQTSLHGVYNAVGISASGIWGFDFHKSSFLIWEVHSYSGPIKKKLQPGTKGGSAHAYSFAICLSAATAPGRGKMKKNSHETGSSEQPRTRITYGEVLPSGAVTDLLTARDRDGLNVVLSDGKARSIAPQVKHDGILYSPPSLDQSIRDAILFPMDVAEADSSDSLLEDVSQVFRDCLRLAAELAAFFTIWIFTSWVPERMLTPVTLCITATTLTQGLNLFRVFRPLARRGLIVAKLSQQLPLALHPTPLITDQTLSVRNLAFWRACNSRGAYVPGTRGSTICNLACSRAVLLRPDGSPDDWGDTVMHGFLPGGEFPPVSESQVKDIAQEFQPRFERYRLLALTRGNELFSQSTLSADSDLARTLFACVRPRPEVVQLVAPLLQSHEQEREARRLRDPRVAVVEALWAPAHGPGKMRVSEIASRVNAILRNRGEIREYSDCDLGWMLKKMNLPTHRERSGQVVRSCWEVRRRLHQLACEFQLQLPTVPDCPDCTGPQLIEQPSVV